MNFPFRKMKYIVSGVPNFTFDQALRLWKTKYKDIRDFHREVITTDALNPLAEFFGEIYDDIIPVTVEEAFANDNTEIRRAYFDCIGITELFRSLDPELLDRQVIKKKRMRWNSNNDPYEYEFEDVYELYKIDGERLFGASGSRFSRPAPVYAVRCWCTTTNKEYWIYVPNGAAHGDLTDDGTSKWTYGKPADYVPPGKPDAVSAIAWTIRIDVSHPVRIYRQGDIILVEESPMSYTTEPYHLNKDQYLSLMYSET